MKTWKLNGDCISFFPPFFFVGFGFPADTWPKLRAMLTATNPEQPSPNPKTGDRSWSNGKARLGTHKARLSERWQRNYKVEEWPDERTGPLGSITQPSSMTYIMREALFKLFNLCVKHAFSLSPPVLFWFSRQFPGLQLLEKCARSFYFRGFCATPEGKRGFSQTDDGKIRDRSKTGYCKSNETRESCSKKNEVFRERSFKNGRMTGK